MALTLKQLRSALEHMDAPELRAVVEDLYKASIDNKRLLTAKLNGDISDLRGKLSQELEKAFRTSGRLPSMKVGGAKKALTAFVKVASPVEALDAELAYVEAGVACLNTYGDWPENNYTSMEKVFEAALARAEQLPSDQIPYERLDTLVENADGFGYGFSDQLSWLYDEFLARMERGD
ncbi:hypothetical protein GCM10017783_20940 [Deinococcus piscis]|uniref:Phage protein n=1 Tax=Deinococcus piscis TaxID=394230 RepID=A0ABQ3K8V0_9DEIO|nr:hypothetical protein [Deinococcus piscis]GHG08164.1 hypothetical protein GCM10017783_20940 [Deinococcus piscis]